MNNSLNLTHSKLSTQNLKYVNHRKYKTTNKSGFNFNFLNHTFIFTLLIFLFTSSFTTSAFAYPHAEIISMSPSHSNVGDTVTFTGHGGREQHGKIVSYEWFSSIDGAIGNGATLKINNLSPGFHKIALRVTNDRGMTHSTKLPETKALDTTQIISVSSNQPKGSNLINNPGFENNLEGNWIKIKSSLQYKQQGGLHRLNIVNQNVKTGTSALAFQRDDQNSINYSSTAQQYISNITPGHTYRISTSAAVKEKTTGFYSVVLRWFFISKRGRLIELPNSRSFVASFDRNSDYINKTIHLTAPTNEIGDAKIAIIYLRSMKANGIAYFDDIEMVDITETEHPLPEAHITHVSSSDTYVGETIELIGDTSFTNGVVTNYQWHSDIDGLLSTEKSFQTNGLSIGEHDISLRIKDESGLWSAKTFKKIDIHEKDNQKNLISNSNFASETPTWRYSQYYLPRRSPYQRSLLGIEILQSHWLYQLYWIKINGDKNNYRSVFQKIENTISSGKTYRFDAKVTTLFKTTGKYFTQVRWYDNTGMEIDGTRTKFGIGTQKNTLLKFVREFVDITAPEGAVSTSIHLVASKADGYSYFKDMSIHQID